LLILDFGQAPLVRLKSTQNILLAQTMKISPAQETKLF